MRVYIGIDWSERKHDVVFINEAVAAGVEAGGARDHRRAIAAGEPNGAWGGAGREDDLAYAPISSWRVSAPSSPPSLLWRLQHNTPSPGEEELMVITPTLGLPTGGPCVRIAPVVD